MSQTKALSIKRILKKMKLTEKNSRPHEGPFHEQTWAFEAPAVNWMLDYWNALRRDRSCPAWSDVDLLSIYKYARLMTVKDAICGNDDFVVRFWGTEIVNVLQYDATREKNIRVLPQTKIHRRDRSTPISSIGKCASSQMGKECVSKSGTYKF